MISKFQAGINNKITGIFILDKTPFALEIRIK